MDRVDRRGIRQAMALVCAGVVVLSGMAAANGGEGTTSGERDDVQTVAREFDMELDQVVDFDALVDEVSALQQELAVKYPYNYGGSFVDRETMTATINWVGDISEAPPILHRNSRIDVRSVEHTEGDLEEIQNTVHDSIELEQIAADSWIDLTENAVYVQVQKSDYFRAQDVIASTSHKVRGAQVVKLEVIDQLAESTASIYGGMSTTTCTSGFTVRNSSNGQLRGSTAGHCQNSQAFGGVASTFVQQWVGGTRDFQIHSFASSHTLTNYITTGTNVRPITLIWTRPATVIGQSVCKYGKTTKHGCGTVHSKTFRPAYIPGASNTFISVKRTGSSPISDFGDSGGPWFYTNRAFGWMSGRVNAGEYGLYMSLSDLPVPWRVYLG